MAIYRMFTGDDGASQSEELTAGTGLLAEAFAAREIQFHVVPTDFVNDFHTAPSRLVVMLLDGQIEFGFRDGTSLLIRRGDAVVVEDTTGTGHSMRIPGETPPVTAVISLE
jgi:hypothetical protein